MSTSSNLSRNWAPLSLPIDSRLQLDVTKLGTNTRRLRFRIFPTHRHDFLLCSSSISHMRCHISRVYHRSAYGRNMAFNHCYTHLHALPRFLASPPCASGTPICRKLLLMSSDVTRWHHHSTSAAMQAPPHQAYSTSATRHRMTSAALLFDPWPNPETQNRPGLVSVDFDPGPVDFDFLRWPLTKSQNSQRAYLAQFFT